ncbi:ATP-dependent endonuclease [Elizabethkingia sp. HX XZB]|uniref:AAA family ATPase n=1 Tax=Elizabethkingia sp. HX XZB TaxID=3003193 RepID=UPI002A240D13|nr:ATP-dependent endonuclease [Elizabethkingia sp. HX XZB]MDX8567363.1 ATP-dependent endonuclease [Elizabethkingia sp. HX XZB]
MKAKQLFIKNFRILEDFDIDLENDISLIIGKNNSGKTSILTILDKFINQSDSNKFLIEDFNLNFLESLTDLVKKNETLSEYEFNSIFFGISLRILIEYNNKDSFFFIQKLMLDLDPDNNNIVLGFDYYLNYDKYIELKKDFEEFKDRERQKKKEAEKSEPAKNYKEKDFKTFLRFNYNRYFQLLKKSVFYDKNEGKIIESNFILIEDIKISDIISFKHISAKRDVTNKETDRTLSYQTSRLYEKKENDESERKKIEDFHDTIINTDEELSKIYETFFDEIIGKIRTLGGIRENDSILSVLSTLQSRELLKGNTTVYYKHNLQQLPEHYNGLGYLNLISMIFEIEIKKYEFQRSAFEAPADINLLFIEEPEAHTHPQMQYVFIKNIKKIVGNKIEKIIKNFHGDNISISKSLQTIITTHSSHIVADSDFDTIKYLKKVEHITKSKNLIELRNAYDLGEKEYQFLKQYLTISRAEIFFADKAILIEGDTERILLPTIMKKMDGDYRVVDTINKRVPLLSQNISIVEVGAYSKIFELFIDFLGIKTLIITDLDTVEEEIIKNKENRNRKVKKACRVDKGIDISNTSLKFFFKEKTLEDLKYLPLVQRCLQKEKGKWVQDNNGFLCVVYQQKQGEYIARSFEDSFLAIKTNLDFVKSNIKRFRGIKNLRYFSDPKYDSYDFAEKCIDKKTHFALDIIYNSNEDYSNWEIPQYIKDGLLWLKGN